MGKEARHHSQNEKGEARYGQYDALLRWAKRRTDCGPISRPSEFLGRTSRGSSRALPSAPEASVDEAQKKGAPAMPEPDLLAESTPTGGWCQMNQASIFADNLPKFYQKFTNFHSVEFSANM